MLRPVGLDVEQRIALGHAVSAGERSAGCGIEQGDFECCFDS